MPCLALALPWTPAWISIARSPLEARRSPWSGGVRGQLVRIETEHVLALRGERRPRARRIRRAFLVLVFRRVFVAGHEHPDLGGSWSLSRVRSPARGRRRAQAETETAPT